MNKLVIATGSNQGDSLRTLQLAREHLIELFGECEHSQVYASKAVDYLDQPDFLNQVLLFNKPDLVARKVMDILLKVEKMFGRTREIARGPRTLDLDIIFFGEEKIESDQLTLPHPRFLQRSFVLRPLLELSINHWVRTNFPIPEHFDTDASPIS